MGQYIYESHLGGLYTSEYLLSDDALYCETCGDYDRELGFASNAKEAMDVMNNQPYEWDEDYLKSFIERNFSKEDE